MRAPTSEKVGLFINLAGQAPALTVNEGKVGQAGMLTLQGKRLDLKYLTAAKNPSYSLQVNLLPPMFILSLASFMDLPFKQRNSGLLLSKTACGVCFGLFLWGGIGLFPVSAKELVRYDFDNAIEEGEKPDRVWTVPDLDATPGTNLTVQESKGQLISSFQDGSALEFFNIAGNAAVSLGQGVDDELKGNFTSGLILEATFEIGRYLDKASQVLFARYGTKPQDRTFSLMVLNGPEENPSGTERTIQFLIYPASGDGPEVLNSNVRVREGETYTIRAVFDPASGVMSMEVSGADNDSVDKMIAISGLRESTAPLYIGGRFDEGNVNRFFGYIDNVRISTVQDPS